MTFRFFRKRMFLRSFASMALMTHPAAGWQIRPYRRDDHVSLESLFLDCLVDFPWRGNKADETVRLRQCIRTGPCLVAEEKTAGLIGFLTLETANAYVPHLFVDRDWRLCGVGGGLLEVARDLARSPLQLDVDLQNEGAIRAYRALGWSEKVNARPSRPDQTRLAGP
ncbi:GNAT family N-acetyltransferase [Henriciella litoralis]|uniref:GNAT family N-acetyltransferase n=1 Tax=Henriciella litoralis TaxID=568102 RepID=UPI00146D972A|nr:GNAT family N-acetyltransferase [Henriciella litoralis]